MLEELEQNNNKDFIIPCPSCKKSQRWSECGSHKPFCSKRCQLIDLGEWANESHSIPGKPVLDEKDNA